YFHVTGVQTCALPIWPSPIESGWYAYAEADYDGDDADFRVRFFNNDADASYWSDTLEVRSVEIDNTAPDAPVLDQESNESGPFKIGRATCRGRVEIWE